MVVSHALNWNKQSYLSNIEKHTQFQLEALPVRLFCLVKYKQLKNTSNKMAPFIFNILDMKENDAK